IQDVLNDAGYATTMVTDNTWLLKPSWKRFRDSFGEWRGIEGQEHQRLRGGAKTKRIELADYITRELRRSDEKRVRAHLKVVETYLRNAG
ncbi:hypothetical protein, partial [Alicyclobacillus fructus]|uniref:hypothetical protein n=1 Tax=Alicyclobacillus fructus TaxID=2816082 RepID=UPI001A9080A9